MSILDYFNKELQGELVVFSGVPNLKFMIINICITFQKHLPYKHTILSPLAISTTYPNTHTSYQFLQETVSVLAAFQWTHFPVVPKPVARTVFFVFD